MKKALLKMWRGGYSLIRTFWGFYVCGGAASIILAAVVGVVFEQAHAAMLGLLAGKLIFAAYLEIATVGVWRSADSYPLTRSWPYIAKTVAVLLTANFYISLAVGGLQVFMSKWF